MVKGTTALTTYIKFIEDYGREPQKEEFIDLGYSKTTYYRIRNEWQDYMAARVEEKEEGGSPLATFEDDKEEGFITDFEVKKEAISMLNALKKNSYSTTLDGKAAVVIDDCSLDSFLWVVNQAISLIKDNKIDWRDN